MDDTHMPEDSGICISTNSGSRNILFLFQNTESSQDQAVCVYGGHLQKCEKILTLRCPSAGASERLDFPYFCSRPPYTHTAWSWLLSSAFKINLPDTRPHTERRMPAPQNGCRRTYPRDRMRFRGLLLCRLVH